jgi:two-component system alkaline phosphatase synthesis response regulator PhoP/OmpR family response regulator RpaB
MGAAILVVDDDPDILAVVAGNLRLSGYEVREAGSAQAALARVAEYPPDLLVLDLGLPDFDGIQVCRRLRREQHDFPIIILTARDGLADKVLGLECGADDYLVKPFEYLELAARIKACLRRREQGRDELTDRLDCGLLQIARRSRTVILHGRQVSLTRKEFDLLAYLVEHAGQAVSRDELRRALWGTQELYRWSRAIDVHVQHLRRKLETDAAAGVEIATVTGIGYRLEAVAGDGAYA